MEVFYLKINVPHVNTYRNLSLWIQSIKTVSDAMIYLIVDRDNMFDYVQKNIDFMNVPHEILRSFHDSPELKDVVSTFSNKWYGAGYAHLTTFLHARDNGYKEFWNIDADDIMLCLTPLRVQQMFNQVKTVSKKFNIHAFSLDAWQTLRQINDWSFGVTYVDNVSLDWIKLMNEHCKDTKYLKAKRVPNADWYFHYLLENNFANCKMFYVDNLYAVVNYGQDIYRAPQCSLRYWHNGRMWFPYLCCDLGMGESGSFKIDSGSTVKVDIGLNLEEGRTFLRNFLINNKYVGEKVRLANFVDHVNRLPSLGTSSQE